MHSADCFLKRNFISPLKRDTESFQSSHPLHHVYDWRKRQCCWIIFFALIRCFNDKFFTPSFTPSGGVEGNFMMSNKLQTNLCAARFKADSHEVEENQNFPSHYCYHFSIHSDEIIIILWAEENFILSGVLCFHFRFVETLMVEKLPTTRKEWDV